MELANKYDDILVRYLLNECDEAEEQFVLDWVNASENNRLYLQELADTLQLVTIKDDVVTIDIEAEWRRFLQAKEEDHQKVFRINTPINKEVHNEEGEQHSQKPKIYRLLIAGAVAASLIIAIMGGLGFFKNKQVDTFVAQKEKNEAAGRNKTEMVASLHVKNTTDSIKNITLPDGTKIRLFANSELTYEELSGKKRREVLLSGTADFKVAKDTAKPFTVNSGALSTTALGTQFLVKASTQEKQILVRLFEGKVVVRSYQNKTLKETYLAPGQELVFDKNTGTVNVRSFTSAAKSAKPDKEIDALSNDNPSVPVYDKKSWFMFSNQRLNEVFDALESLYDVKINYSKKEVDKMYFIGTFDKSDSIGNILKQISAINNLVVKKR